MSVTAAPLQALIIGCGNIAGGFDYSRPADTPPLTHAGAYVRNPAFNIAACVEPDAERRAFLMTRRDLAQCLATSMETLTGGHYGVTSDCSPIAAQSFGLLTQNKGIQPAHELQLVDFGQRSRRWN